VPQRTAQLPPLVEQAQNKDTGAQQSKGPSHNKQNKESDWYCWSDRSKSQVNFDIPWIVAGKPEHHHENNDDQESNANFLQHAPTPKLSARKLASPNFRDSVLLLAGSGKGCLVLNGKMTTGVDSLAQIFSRLEVRHVFAGQRYSLTSFGITSNSRRSKVERKTAKSANLDTFAASEGIAHQIQQVLDGKLNILCGQMLLLSGDHFYEF